MHTYSPLTEVLLSITRSLSLCMQMIDSKGRPDDLVARETWRRYLLRNDRCHSHASLPLLSLSLSH